MSTILISIKPEYVAKIFAGTKRFEYRKRLCKEKIDKMVVYSSYPVKKVVGELIIKDTICDDKLVVWHKTHAYGGISKENYDKYFEGNNKAVAFEIEKVIFYKKPKKLEDYNVTSAPQSYVYIR